jgi:hypothetical protein
VLDRALDNAARPLALTGLWPDEAAAPPRQPRLALVSPPPRKDAADATPGAALRAALPPAVSGILNGSLRVDLAPPSRLADGPTVTAVSASANLSSFSFNLSGAFR